MQFFFTHIPYILAILTIFPLACKYLFWLYLIQLKEYRFDRFFEYLNTPQGIGALFHKLFFVDIIVFLCLVYSFIDLRFKNTFYIILAFILVFCNIFIAYKWFTKKRILYPKITFRLCYTVLVLLTIESIYFLIFDDVVAFIAINFCAPIIFLGLTIFISYPIVNILKYRKFRIASNISKKYDEVIKIGITGSYGKTSGKEYLVQILGSKFRVLKTPENINTEMGISNVIIDELNSNYDYFVAEMGAYKIGEIKQIGEIVNHKYGFITAIGNQHLGLFGSIENTMKAKSEVAMKVLENNGILYINRDNKRIRELKFNKRLKVVRYGTHKGSDALSKVLEINNKITKFHFEYKGKKTIFKTNMIGNHNVVNITGVIAFCIDIGMKRKDIRKIVVNLEFPKDTSELIETKKNLVLNDTYNMSEGGLLAGLETMNSFKHVRNKILIIDDILELGNKSEQIHHRIGKKIAKEKLVNQVFFVGVNYKISFTSGLVDGGMLPGNIINNLDFVHENDILLFEGRKAGVEMKKFLNENS